MAEVLILLDLMQTLSEKSYEINSQNIIISINNSKVSLMIHGSMKVVNHFN